MKLRLHILLFIMIATQTVFAEEPKTVKITISPETTYITGPTLPDGRIDYLKALNEELSKGITKENNLIVGIFQMVPGEMEYPLLREADNPKELALMDYQRDYRKKYWAMLGFDAPPPLESLVSLHPLLLGSKDEIRKKLLAIYSEEEINKKLEPIKTQERGFIEEKYQTKKITEEEYKQELKNIDEETPDWQYREIVGNEWTATIEKPWTEKNFPYLAKWIVSMEPSRKRLMEIYKRTDYYSPLVPHESEPQLYAVLLPYCQSMRETAQFLNIYANWYFAHGEYEKAFESTFASIRMGQTMQKNVGCIVEMLIGLTMESIPNYQITQYLLELDSSKDADWFLMKKREIDEIYHRTTPPHSFPLWVKMERYGILSTIQFIAHQPQKMTGFLEEYQDTDFAEKKEILKRFVDAEYSYDWDKILRLTNVYMDEVEDAASLPGLKQQLRAIIRFTNKLNHLDKSQWVNIAPNADREQLFTDALAYFFLPPIEAVFLAQCRTEWDRRITSLAFALAAYRADHKGENPETLDELVPKYLDAVPESPYTEEPMRYIKRAGDVLISNDDYLKLDGSEPEVEKMITETPPGGRAFPDARHFLFIVQKKGIRSRTLIDFFYGESFIIGKSKKSS